MSDNSFYVGGDINNSRIYNNQTAERRFDEPEFKTQMRALETAVRKSGNADAVFLYEDLRKSFETDADKPRRSRLLSLLRNQMPHVAEIATIFDVISKFVHL